MPLFALCAGLALLALEWRDGVSFWLVFAVGLIAFAAWSLMSGNPPEQE